MPLIDKNSSFYIFRAECDKKAEEIKDLLQKHPVKDISGTGEEETFGFVSAKNLFIEEIERIDGLVAFNYRQDKKIIGKDKINHKCKKVTLEMYPNKEYSKLTDEEKEEVRAVAISEIAKVTSPTEKGMQMLWDTERGFLYVEKKGEKELFLALAKISEIVEAEFELFSPFQKDFLNQYGVDKVYNLFYAWLYAATVDSDVIKNQDIVLNSKIKFSDAETEIAVKGKINMFYKIYKQFSQSKKIKECQIKYNSEDHEIKYTLNNKNMAISGLYDSRCLFKKSEFEESLMEKAESLFLFSQHFETLAGYFEKLVNSKGLEEVKEWLL